ncbi:MAG: hypothetical protein IJN77_00375 [Oscillospiraceae bacterium]|nr:hypothetical protein [Oscillospiraceae bacterium]
MYRLLLYKGSLPIIAAIFLLAVLCCFLMTGCHAPDTPEPADNLPAGTMVMDYYCKATADAGGYSEMVLSTTDDSNTLQLSVYTKTDETASEQCTEYFVPYKTALECYTLIESESLKQWSHISDTVSTDGTLIVFKFYDNGSYIRVSSDNMPENGEIVLNRISNTMMKYITIENYVDSSQIEV